MNKKFITCVTLNVPYVNIASILSPFSPQTSQVFITMSSVVDKIQNGFIIP